jgi:hypothetical protein
VHAHHSKGASPSENKAHRFIGHHTIPRQGVGLRNTKEAGWIKKRRCTGVVLKSQRLVTTAAAKARAPNTEAATKCRKKELVCDKHPLKRWWESCSWTQMDRAAKGRKAHTQKGHLESQNFGAASQVAAAGAIGSPNGWLYLGRIEDVL